MAKRWYYKDENGNKVPVPQYKINSDNHYTKSDADNKFATKESTDTKVAKTDIVQSVGNATDKIMSQKASTDSFIANTPSGDPMHNLYVEVGAIYNDTGKDIERVDQWGDTIIHKDGCWYLNGLGDLTNYDLLKCWIDHIMCFIQSITHPRIHCIEIYFLVSVIADFEHPRASATTACFLRSVIVIAEVFKCCNILVNARVRPHNEFLIVNWNSINGNHIVCNCYAVACCKHILLGSKHRIALCFGVNI